MGRFDGKTAIVTGAGRGLGAAYARALAGEGAAITAADVIDTGATVGAISATGGRAIGISCDVTNTDQIAAMVGSTVEAFGGVDILVNNAARVVDFDHGSFLDIDEAEWDSVMQVNTRGAFSCVKAVAPIMRKTGYGKIVNISSNFAMGGAAFASHYAAAKSALSGFTKSWAREFAPYKICVNAVAPGILETPMTLGSIGKERIDAMIKDIPLGRIAEPIDISYAVAWLACPETDFMTGQVISPNGGVTIVGI